MSNKLIATYGRVSTSNQENEGTIETQLRAVTEFAKENNYTIVKSYTDEGWSGDILTRPGLDQLRVDAKNKNKEWEAVLIYDPDRLARRGAWQEIVIEELKELGVEVLFVTVPPPKSDEDIIMYKMRGIFTEYERMKIKERFRLGKLRKVMEGHILTTEALYGYTYIKKQDNVHGYYVINEEEAKIVRMIFDWVVKDKMNIRGVVRKLHLLGIKPRKSTRGVWSTSTLSTMLRHKGYIGYAHWGSSYAVAPDHPLKDQKYKKVKKSSRRTKPESEWVSNCIPIPPLVSEETFNKARLQLTTNFELCKRTTKNKYLLQKKVWCSCGSRRTGEGVSGTPHLYYRCSSRVHTFPLPPTCMEKGVNAKYLDDLVWNRIVELMTSPTLLEKEVSKWMRGDRGNRDVSENILHIDKEVEKLNNKIVRFNKAYAAGLYTVEELASYVNPVKAEIKLLKLKKTQIIDQNNQEYDILDISHLDLKGFSNEVSLYLKNLTDFDAKQAIVSKIIDRVVVTQERVEVWGFIPVNTEVYKDMSSSVLSIGMSRTLPAISFYFSSPLPRPGSTLLQRFRV